LENQFTNAAFKEYLQGHKLMGTRDSVSGEVFLPPRPINPKNLSTDMEWVEFSGKGTLVAFAGIFINTSAMVEAGYNRKNPSVVGIVKTNEGPMISALILGLNGCEPGSIKIGTPVSVKYLDQGEGEAHNTLLAFEPI